MKFLPSFAGLLILLFVFVIYSYLGFAQENQVAHDRCLSIGIELEVPEDGKDEFMEACIKEFEDDESGISSTDNNPEVETKEEIVD